MSTNAEHPARDPPVDIYVRPAQLGDICVLLEPTDQGELRLLRQRQLALQACFGGKPIENVHLTCQRFESQEERSIERLVRDLERALAEVEPCSCTAIGLQTLYVPVLQTNILKWTIRTTQEVQRFATLVEETLIAREILPLYRSGFVSSLIAALRDVPEPIPDRLLDDETFAYPLFTPGKVVLSRIVGPSRFEILATLPLTRSLPQSTDRV